MKPILTAFLFSMILHQRSFAQQLFKPDYYCAYDGKETNEDIYTFTSDQDANSAVERILRYSGLQKNFIIHAANVSNAQASIKGNTRYILYNQNFIIRVRQTTSTDWSAISIMAHEIGHHLQGHTLLGKGSRPEIELEADKYSGFVLQKMGATLDQAKAAINMIASTQASSTHPSKNARLAAITNGWIEAKELAELAKPNDEKKPSEKDSQPQTQPGQQQPRPTEEPVRYVSRCVFYNDPVTYYVTNKNQLIGVNALGQSVIVGQKIPPTVAGFVWMYSTPFIIYGVDAYGRIWNRYPNGVPYQIGFVTNP